MITRDAKIGMLVVLAFCLIVGILLSEHMTSATVPPQASLAQAGQHVRQGTNAPTPIAPVAAGATVIDADPQPRTPVTTRDTLDAPPAPTTTAKIELGRPIAGEMKVIRVDGTPDRVAGAVQVAVPATSQLDAAPPAPASTLPEAVAKTLTPGRPSAALDALAKQHGLELVPVAASAQTSPKVAPVALTNLAGEPRPLAPLAGSTKTKEVIAQRGDTLSKLAGRTLGANTPQNRQAIVDLNPSLQKNAERILAGATYLVPADAWSAALNVDAGTPAAAKLAAKPADARPTDAKAAEPKAADATPTIAYQVKSGDSLWKLAAGDAGAFAQIKALNADVLKGGETVKIGMKLTLPAKAKV